MARRKRRAKGSGSLYHTTARGWIVQRERTPTADGKRRFERISFGRDKAAALRQVAAWEQERAALAQHAQAGDTLHAWLEHWLTTKQENVAPSTLRFYERHLDYVVPHLGGVRLLDLTPQHIRDCLAALTDGLAPRSRAHVRTVLRQALQLAVDDGVLLRNPADAVDAPKVAKFAAHALTDTERLALLAVVDTHRLRAMWHILIDLGPRINEILAVRWIDLDRAARTLRIRATKTDRERHLPLTDGHLALLDVHRTQQADERADNPRWKDHGYIFASETGTLTSHHNARRAFKSLIDRVNAHEAKVAAEAGRPARIILPRTVRLHDLRHTAATNLIAAGVDIPTVQYIIGHHDSGVLLEIYAHAHADRNHAGVERVVQQRRNA